MRLMERHWRLASAVGAIVVMAVAVTLTAVRGGLEHASWMAAIISLLTVPAAVLAWALRRSDPPASSLDEHLAGVADELAPRIRAEWISEAKVRGLIGPAWDQAGETEPCHLLPVRWSKVGANCRPGGAPRGRVHRADSVAGLVASYLGVNGRRLVILGEAGSGKSALAVLMTLGLLKDRLPGGPVPVLFPLASWDPGEPLIDWLAARLGEAVPPLGKRIARKRLREHVPAYRHGKLRKLERTLAYQLIHTGRILPVMDGLDEIPGARHGSVVPRINEAADRLPGYVLTCRADAYPEAEPAPELVPEPASELASALEPASELALEPASELALEPASGLAPEPAPTSAAAAAPVSTVAPASARGREVLHDVWRVRLEPVPLDDARRFLADPASDGEDRWEPVFARLAATDRSDHEKTLADVLASPLMLSLASRVYRSRLEKPTELLDPEICADKGAMERRLLSGLVRQAFRDARWPLAKAERWLAELAAQTHRQNPSRIRWWELTRHLRPATAVLAGVLGAVISGVATGLGFYVVFGPVTGLVAGLAGAIALGVPCALSVPAPAELQFQLSGRIRRAFVSGSAIGTVSFLAGHVAYDWEIGLAASLTLGLPVSVLYGCSVQGEISKVVTPGSLLRRDRVVALAFGLVYGVPLGVIGAVVVGHKHGVPVGVVFGIVFGIAAGLAGGLLYGLFWALALKVMNIGVIAWVHLILVQVCLVARGRGPWRLMQFFEHAHQRGVFRQIGAAYEFSHARLQDELAQRQRP
ncbi:hypothetical protein [Actinomadura sp. 6N118]|uniref:hypothetical protein n=1 Tax=Actinomadura sp. 6N118 TaxID=3375151 RepID=UPI0037872D4F